MEKNQKHADHSNEHGHKAHLISFSLSIILTVLAFIAVGTGTLSRTFVLPFLVLLALAQAIFQAAYWMHMNQKGHEFPITFMLSGFLCAIVVVFACTSLVWW